MDVAGRLLTRDELVAHADDDAARRAAPWSDGMSAVPFSALVPEVPDGTTHATFLASDGYAVSIPIEQALRDGVVLVPPASSGRTGVRLIVPDGTTKCVNVKAVERVELSAGQGKHTVDPNPHSNPAVPGWDEPDQTREP